MVSKSKKIDMEAEARAANGESEVESAITDELLLELCPTSSVATAFKRAKTPAARADLLYSLEKGALRELRQNFTEMEKFCNKLEAWFIQEMPDNEDTTGVSGKLARVEIKRKEIATVSDWDKFYANIKKKGEFELLNRAVNQKAVKERWDQGKLVPGVEKFTKRVISLTAVKGAK